MNSTRLVPLGGPLVSIASGLRPRPASIECTANQNRYTINVGSMAFLSSSERGFLPAASRLAFCNPFLPERVAHERAALGDEFVEDAPVWSFSVAEPDRQRSNVWRIA